MRLAPLLTIAATAAAAAAPQSSNTSRILSAKNILLSRAERKHAKKKNRQDRKKKKAEDAQLKAQDPLLGLENEIKELSHLEDVLSGNESDSPILNGIAALEQAEDSPEPETIQDCTQEMCMYLLSDDYILEYKINVPNDTIVDECEGCSLSVKLTYEGTAWLAFAFSTNGEMVGSEAVIGHPLMADTEPGKYYLGGKYDGGIQPMEDTKQTLLNAKITFEDGQSSLEFTKLMKEEGEITISTGLNTFLWAHGEDNSMSTYHGNNRSPIDIDLLGTGIGNTVTKVETSTSSTDNTVTTLSSMNANDTIVIADSAATSKNEDGVPPCPPAYDPSHKYTAGDIVEVGNFIWECRKFPYDMYCNVPDFHPSLVEENPNAEELWMNAWSKSLGECVKPPGSPTSKPSSLNLTRSPTTKTVVSESPSEIVLTALPTASPVGPPTAKPTDNADSDKAPSGGPTVTPSLSPTVLTDDPTMFPSLSPSITSNNAPSYFPTTPPSYYPTYVPTKQATPAPTCELPFPLPELRFIEWQELGLNELTVAESLGYNKMSWNNLEISDLESTAFENLSATEQQGAMALGFDQETWNCFMFHYNGYSWNELEDSGVVQYFVTLGWTQDNWDGDEDSPDSDDMSWEELSEEEQFAATKICYTQNAWNWIPLPSW